MQRRPYNKRNKPATLRCPNYRCDNISSKLYIVEDKLIEVLQIWLSNYKIEYEKDNQNIRSSYKKILMHNRKKKK